MKVVHLRFPMQKSPFILMAVCGACALLFAILAKEIGNTGGAQFLLAVAATFLFFYAIVRVVFDFLPRRYFRGGEHPGHTT